MIEGAVKRSSDGGLEAWVALSVMGVDGELQQCDVIVDTGFTGWLTLPELGMALPHDTPTCYGTTANTAPSTRRYM